MKQTQQLHVKDISTLIWLLNLKRSELNPRGQMVQGLFAKRQTSLQEGLWIRTKQQFLDKQEVWEWETRGPYRNPTYRWAHMEGMSVSNLRSDLEESKAIIRIKGRTSSYVWHLSCPVSSLVPLLCSEAARVHLREGVPWLQNSIYGFVITFLGPQAFSTRNIDSRLPTRQTSCV